MEAPSARQFSQSPTLSMSSLSPSITHKNCRNRRFCACHLLFETASDSRCPGFALPVAGCTISSRSTAPPSARDLCSARNNCNCDIECLLKMACNANEVVPLIALLLSLFFACMIRVKRAYLYPCVAVCRSLTYFI